VEIGVTGIVEKDKDEIQRFAVGGAGGKSGQARG
jgi:hypothetical protein